MGKKIFLFFLIFDKREGGLLFFKWLEIKICIKVNFIVQVDKIGHISKNA